MSVRAFNGAGDFITLAAGSVTPLDAGPITLFGVWKANLTHAGAILCARGAINPVFGNNPFSDGSEYFTAGTFVGRPYTFGDGWVITTWTKAGGNSMVRHHRCVLSTDTWAHTDTSAMTDSANGPVADITIGRWAASGDFFNGRIAAVAVYESVLSDEQIEALRNGMVAVMDAAPVGAWRFNQSNVGTAVEDLTGNGADQSAITGTSVVTGDDPPSFNLSLADELSVPVRRRASNFHYYHKEVLGVR